MKKYLSLILDFVVLLLIVAMVITFVTFQKINYLGLVTFFIIVYFVNFVFITYLYVGNDSNEEKKTWIFFLFFFPVVSHILFMLFRFRRPSKIPRQKYNQDLKDFQIERKECSNLTIFEKNQQNATYQLFHNSKIELYKHGFESYEKLFCDLEKAKKFIYIEMYIIKPSEIYERFKNILIKKAKEGVEVKIIVDDFGSWLITKQEFKYLKSCNIQIERFNRSIYPLVKPTDNNRLHKKIIIIDNYVVHSGGLNISDEYSSFSRHYGYWADLNFSLKGEIINDYISSFLYDWYKKTGVKLDKNKYLLKEYKEADEKHNSKVLLFEDGPNVKFNLLEHQLISWINQSKKSIKISTPYFVPNEVIIRCLIFALERNVEVTIFIPGKPDKKIVYSATKCFLEILQLKGAKIVILNDIFLHTKAGIFDDEFAYIGTNNIDMRSLYSNFESINIITGDEPIKKLNEIFEDYKKLQKTELKIKNNKFIKGLKKFIYILFAPLM